MSNPYSVSESGLDARMANGMGLGFLAGLIFVGFEIVVAVVTGSSPFEPPQLMGSILLGEGSLAALATPAFVAMAGLTLHFLLSALYGGVFGAIVQAVRPIQGNRPLLVAAGAVFGLLLWIVNFYLISPVLFPWFAMVSPLVQFLAHTFFYGALLGLLFALLPQQTTEPNQPEV